jgi:hypothetical protein
MAKKRQRKKRAMARLSAAAVQTSLFQEGSAPVSKDHWVPQFMLVNRPTLVRPPVNFDFILYMLMPRADCEALIGDLEEQYRNLIERLGKRRADIWYGQQVLTSVWPLLSSSIRRLGNSTVVNALCLVLRFWGLGSVAEDLKRMPGAKRKQK